MSRIETYHVIEHVPHPDVPGLLRYWYGLLENGGLLVLECPDFDADVRDYLAGEEDRLLSIFGRQRYRGDVHYWGYSGERLSRALREVGFVDVKVVPAQDYHAESEPCIRVEARK